MSGPLADPARAGRRRVHRLYNGTRMHSSLGCQSTATYETNHQRNVRQVARLVIDPVVKAGQPESSDGLAWPNPQHSAIECSYLQ